MARSFLTGWADKSGASALEFAILLPVFVSITLGTLQLGLLFFQANTVQHMLEETARELMVTPGASEAQVREAIAQRLEQFVIQPVVVDYAVTTAGEASIAHINASFTIELIVPFLRSISVPMDAQTVVPLRP